MDRSLRQYAQSGYRNGETLELIPTLLTPTLRVDWLFKNLHFLHFPVIAVMMIVMDAATIASEITSIKNQLLEKFHPEKIILFGSTAQSRHHANSDLDVLVVKNDIRRPLEVEQELHRIIRYRFATDFIFLSTDDYARRLKDGDFFLKEVLAHGRVLHG